MVGKIASTSFETGPKDAVAAVDVYGKPPITPLNAVIEAGQGATDIASKALKRAEDQNILGQITQQALSDLTDTGKIDKASALAKIKSVTGGLGSSVTALKGNVLTTLLKSVGYTNDPEGMAKGLLGVPGAHTPVQQLVNSNPKLKLVVGTAEVLRKDADLNTANGIADLMNSISGNSELAKALDMESQFAVLGSIVAMAKDYDIPDILDTVLDQFHTIDEQKAFLRTQIKPAFYDANLRLIVTIQDNLTSHEILGILPNAVNLLLTNYHFPIGVGVVSEPLYTQLTDILDNLDPNWTMYNRNGSWIFDLGIFTYASDDAKAVIRYNSAFHEMLMTAEHYPSRDLMGIAQSHFPYAPM